MSTTPGTFDPVTYGHLDVIGAASAMYDRWSWGSWICPGARARRCSPPKSGSGSCGTPRSELSNVAIETFNLLVDFAREKKAMAIVKGLRAISDFEYELEMNQLNHRRPPRSSPFT